jgi:RND family efflux transporter MFP subunit
MPPNPFRNPGRRPGPRILKFMIALAVVGGGVWAASRWWPSSAGASTAVITAAVTRSSLPITVTERGELESAQTVDGRCEVEVQQIKIVSILPEGAKVTKGQEVVKFDTEQLQKNFVEQEIKWKQAEGKAKAAKGDLEVQLNKSEGEIAEAELKLTLADLDLEKYVNGDYKADEEDKKASIELARKDLEDAKDKLEFYRSFVKKGFGTPEQMRVKELEFAQKEYLLKRDEAKLAVLQNYERKRKLYELEATAKDAKRKLIRTRNSAAAADEKAKTDLEAAQVTAKLEKENLERTRDQLGKCVVKAPQDGILVYSKDRYWDPASRIQAGGMVHFQQTLFSLPDLAKMQIKVKVHESVVKKVQPGQKTEITIDALPNQVLHGTVEKVGTLAYSDFYYSQGVKEYLTVIKMDDLPEAAGLKPGMTGEVKILVKNIPDSLLVPVQAVTEHGGQHYAYVVKAGGAAERRAVTVGEANEKYLQVVSGLEDGERVALDARARGAAEAKAEETKAPPAASPKEPPAQGLPVARN